MSTGTGAGETPKKQRLALLDLLAQADGFVGDGVMPSLAARLTRDGHAVRLLRSVLAEDAAGDLDVWHGKIAAFLDAGGGFDLLVLSRAWEPRTLAALREAVPGARLVRLGSGVPARIDELFDHVLDPVGLLALLGGDANPETAVWSPMTPRELREIEAVRLTVLPRAAETRPEGLGPTSSPGQRPTITGPAAGCPFLLDSRKSAIYRDLEVDEDQVQMKGCTFCLDNVGTYAPPSEGEMVSAWLRQLRGVRAGRPHKEGDRPLEVLCTDERPHPYLPALFRAIAEEPGLAPIELLIKSRVDWLLEFADGPVAEAARQAERSGSILHVYLVGFEAFDAFHLELYNKGVSVADNVAAIEKLRELGARFPRSFEYLRFRAHGIVIFTPWTRPEHLLENARVLREVRFHELRSEALRTRLRLYPRVPLHALARRDGLLVEGFEDGRGDRAAEQGYDASVPWRFEDVRTEAIYRVANSPELRKRGYRDADVLEAATRFILRWPGIAAAPDLAALPFEQALRIWSPPPASDGASSLGFDPEVDGIRAGAKDACLKEAVPRAEAEPLVAAYRAMGLSADVVWTHGMSETGDVHTEGGDAFAIVAVARDEEVLARVLEAQRSHRGRDAEAARRMGRLMGYPGCCVDAFLAQRQRGDNLENERATFRRAPEQALDPLLNRFAVVRLASHHPCSPGCAPSVTMADRLLGRLAEADPRAAAWVVGQLGEPVLVPDYSHRIGVRGAWEGDWFRVDSARCLDDPRRMPVRVDGIDRVTVSKHHVSFVYQDGSTVQLDVHAPILVTPGAPLRDVALAAIAADPESPPAPSLPPLPDSFRPGGQVLGYRILGVRGVADGPSGAAHRVELGLGAERLVVRVRPFDPARPQALRRGAWALDVEGAGALPDRARAALVLLARALPA